MSLRRKPATNSNNDNNEKNNLSGAIKQNRRTSTIIKKDFQL